MMMSAVMYAAAETGKNLFLKEVGKKVIISAVGGVVTEGVKCAIKKNNKK